MLHASGKFSEETLLEAIKTTKGRLIGHIVVRSEDGNIHTYILCGQNDPVKVSFVSNAGYSWHTLSE